MTTPSNDKTSLDTKPSNPGDDEKPTGQPTEPSLPYGIAPPYGITPPVAPTAPSENEKFIASETGVSSVPNQSVGPGQNPVGNYYAPVHSYTPSAFNNGYTPLQPVLNQPPANMSAEPTAPPPIPGTESAFPAGPPTSIPITAQPMPSGPPVIGFAPPPAYDAPITAQPMPTGPAPMNYGTPLPGPTEGWMAPPPLIPVDCPPGLEYLTTIDSLFVKQKVELLEAFTGFETNNKYSIRNKDGDKVFYVIEDNDCCNRNCCGSIRSFVLRVYDKSGTEIIQICRDLRCDSCLFPCCLQELTVYAPPGNLVGTVVQQWAICQPIYDINDDGGKTVLRIEGPVCQCSMCGDVDFNVLSLNREAVVGKISKQWSGLAREFFTDADNFGISFPLDLAVRMKAVMIGACFLIDFMYFEQTSNDSSSCLLLKCFSDCLNMCIITDSCSGHSGSGANGSGGGCCCCGDDGGCCDGDGGCCDGNDGCCDGNDGCCDDGGGGCCDGNDGGDCCDGGGGDCGDCGDCDVDCS